MNRLMMTLSATAMLAGMTSAALANNPAVEETLKSRSDLSSFYQALMNTGVAAELNSGTNYTIFAPTNDAFLEIPQDKYPCFYSTACKAQVADIVRNHIVPGNVYVSDTAKQKGGVYSINKRFVNIGQPARNSDIFTADGNNITYTNWYSSGVIYKIDGVIAHPQELSAMQAVGYPVATTTTVQRTIPMASCGPAGCPDSSTTTTTVSQTTIAPAR